MKASKESKLVLFIILLLTPLTGASIDIYVPSMAHMALALHSNGNLVAATIPSYLFGYGVFLLIIGPLSDSLGRRRVLLVCLSGYIITTLLIIQSSNINSILIYRFIQGAFVGGPSLITKALLSDIYQGQRLKRYVNYNAIAWACGPIIAPVIGGYLQAAFDWHAPFYFLSVYALLSLVLVYIYLPETQLKKKSLHWQNILGDYRLVVSNKQFVIASIVLTLLYSEIISFNVQGAYLLQHIFNIDPITFGHIALLMGAAWFLGNVSCRLLSSYLTDKQLMTSSILLPLSMFIAIFTCLPYAHLSLSALISISFVVLFFAAQVFPIFYNYCISSYPQAAATASGVMTTIYITGASLISFILSTLSPQSDTLLLITYSSLFCFIGLMLYTQTIPAINPKRAD